jgi:hypothetical protein
MALSVENIAVSSNSAVERLDGEVGFVGVHNTGLDCLAIDFLLLVVIYEMVLFFLNSMVNRDHSSIFWQEADGDQRFEESRDWLRLIVKLEKL